MKDADAHQAIQHSTITPTLTPNSTSIQRPRRQPNSRTETEALTLFRISRDGTTHLLNLLPILRLTIGAHFDGWVTETGVKIDANLEGTKRRKEGLDASNRSAGEDARRSPGFGDRDRDNDNG